MESASKGRQRAYSKGTQICERKGKREKGRFDEGRGREGRGGDGGGEQTFRNGAQAE